MASVVCAAAVFTRDRAYPRGISAPEGFVESLHSGLTADLTPLRESHLAKHEAVTHPFGNSHARSRSTLAFRESECQTRLDQCSVPPTPPVGNSSSYR